MTLRPTSTPNGNYAYFTSSATIRTEVDQIVVSTWTTADYLPGPMDVTERPLAVFAACLMGGYRPVIGLSVTATLGGNNSFELLDNGGGCE